MAEGRSQQTLGRSRSLIAALVLGAALGIGALPASAATTEAVPAPTNTEMPAIEGSAETGQTLAATTGTWDNSPSSYGYQWEDCDAAGANCVAIPGATAATYRLASSDVGHTVRVVVKATNANGSGKASSRPTAVVAEQSSAAQPGGGQSGGGCGRGSRGGSGNGSANGSASGSGRGSANGSGRGSQQGQNSTKISVSLKWVSPTTAEVSGSVSPRCDGRRLMIQMRTRRGWKTVATVRLRSRTPQSSQFSLDHKLGSGVYRVLLPGSSTSSQSTSRLITVRDLVTLTAETSHSSDSKDVTISGTATPAENGGRLVVQLLTAKGWHNVASTLLYEDGSDRSAYSITLTSPEAGTYRVFLSADQTHRGSPSSTFKIA